MKKNRTVSVILYGITGLLLFTLIWKIIGSFIFKGVFEGFQPVLAMKAFSEMVFTQHFLVSVLVSLKRILYGLFFAFILGCPAGIIIGSRKIVERLTSFPIHFIRMISPLAWMPIAILVFPTFEQAIHFLLTMACIWPILMNTAQGIQHVDHQWIRMAKNQGASKSQLLFKIYLPNSIPYILTGLRLALGISWIVLVPAEFLGVTSGLGYLINDARNSN